MLLNLESYNEIRMNNSEECLGHLFIVVGSEKWYYFLVVFIAPETQKHVHKHSGSFEKPPKA